MDDVAAQGLAALSADQEALEGNVVVFLLHGKAVGILLKQAVHPQEDFLRHKRLVVALY
ncbi:hypothetical protein [Mucilaginibacter mali]|uniref:hypothetical protein n=1 Tax=Mucilaginibacter mali TaxID=2740462 RepID=UPI00191DDF4A|nr:hypothetical protein [Mucilaginibacter mali]